MKLILRTLGALIILIGILLLVIPETSYSWVEANYEATTFYFGAIVGRLVFGVLLFISAKQSKFPKVLKVLAFLMILAAFTFVLMGLKTFQDMVFFMLITIKPYMLVSGLLSIVFGAFLTYAYTEKTGRIR